MSILNVDKIQPIGGGSTITVDATDIQASTGTIRASTFSGDVSATGIGVTSLNVTGVTTSTTFVGALTGNVTGNATGLSGTPNISAGTIAGSTGTFSGAISGTTGTFTGDVDIADTIVHTGDTNTKIRFPSADNISFEVAGTERLRIDDSDGVISKHTTAANLRIQNSTAASSQVAQLDMAPAGSISGVQLKCTSEEDFSTGANRTAYFTIHNRKDGAFYERLRIDSSGNIGIGGAPSAWTTTTTKALQIGNACLFNFNDTYFHLGQNFYFDGSNYKLINNGWATRLLQNAGEFTFLTSDASGSADGNINFQSKVRITTGGDVDVEDGDIFFSTSGKGIVLGATSNTDANTLDDYEEGTWTPAIGGQTSTVGHANYTKIGNFVHLDFDVTNSTGGAHTYISGLPFANGEYSAWHVAWISDNAGGTNTGSNQIGGLITSSNLSLRAAGGNQAINIDTNQRIIGSAQYRV